MSPHGWIGVDLDGTLAVYNGWKGPTIIGEPVPAMADRVKAWLAEGREVRIFTARIFPINDCIRSTGILQYQPMDDRGRQAVASLRAIQEWCGIHFRNILPVTNVKDMSMVELYDDRCVQVELNTGRLIEDPPKGEATP